MGPSLAESWKESPDGKTYEFKLRARAQVPQRRPRHHRGREVQLRALQGRGRQGAPGARPRGRDRRSADGALPPEGAVAGLHDLLRHDGHRGRDRRARRSTSRRSATTASRSTRSAPGPTSSSATSPGSRSCSRRTPGYWRRVPNVKRLVMKSVPEATTRAVMLKSGEADIAVALDGPDAEDIKRDPRMQVVASQARVDLLDRVRRAVGSEVAVARQAAAPGRELRARPQGDQRGRVPRLLSARRRDRAAGHGLRAAGRAAALRSAARPSSSSPRPAIRTGSTPESSRRSRASRRWPSRC